jgi:hypothetical protein
MRLMAPDNADGLYKGDLATEVMDAAMNAARICLGAKPGEIATIVLDEQSRQGTAAIVRALKQIGVEVHTYVIEEMGKRPLVRFPADLLQSLEASQLSVFWAIPLPGELTSRLQILEAATEHKLRHAHLIGLSLENFVEGLAMDYRNVRNLQERIIERLARATSLRVINPAGTDLEVPLGDDSRWTCLSGIIEPGRWQNLPSGQIMHVPDTANGTFVADAAVGEWFGTRYENVSEFPLSVEIEDGRALDARSANSRLAREFLLYVRSNPNADRIGELSLGTNLGLTRFTGKAVIDENIPGCHIALGDPLGELTGATWSSKTHVPLICREASIYVDDTPIMEDGRYIEDLASIL